MRVVIVGTGYVGLVTGACLADVGSDVTCVDVNAEKIEALQRGVMPIYEPGLAEVVSRTVAKGRLRFATSLTGELGGADAVFIAVGTPSDEDGSADLRHVETVARQIGEHMTDYMVVITKSTVPVGTAEKVRTAVQKSLDARGVTIPFDVASNPEFLKEGAAIADFLRPDRIVVGVESPRAKAILERVYRPFVLNGHRMIFMDVASAELTKYAANAMLATRISFMNMIAGLCESFGADILSVRQGIGSDPRIGSQFLYAGIGYGGSCFPKDVRALIHTGKECGFDMEILTAVEAVNERQKGIFVDRLQRELGDLTGKKIAVWGLAFKPETDDIRDAPALTVIRQLVSLGAKVCAYDPVAIPNTKRELGDICEYVDEPFAAIEDADVLLLLTEWSEFRSPSLPLLQAKMKGRLVLDGRNVLDAALFADSGFRVIGVGTREVLL